MCKYTPSVHTFKQNRFSNTVQAGSNFSDIAEKYIVQKTSKKAFWCLYLYLSCKKKNVEINMNTYEVGKSK